MPFPVSSDCGYVGIPIGQFLKFIVYRIKKRKGHLKLMLLHFEQQLKLC